MPAPSIELLQFRFSHYNEKVRWALDYKRVPHVRIDFLPGPHAPQIKKLTGQTSVPVLRIDGKVVTGSARIVDEIERRFPSPPLYPADAARREEALALQQRLDDKLGPAARRIAFDAMLQQIDYVPTMFSVGKPEWKRTLYRTSFPLLQGLVRKANGVTPERVARAETTVAETLDFLVEKTRATGHLVGDTFTIADLTAAALLAPLVHLTHPDMAKPEPMPPAFRAVIDRLASHPGVVWVQQQYARHRPQPSSAAAA
jgi:glutathione S-transferase